MMLLRRTGRLLTSFVVVAASLTAAPNAPAQAEAPPRASDEALHKIDEFGLVNGCDHSARLDNFAIVLMNDPSLVGYVIAYGPEGQGSGSGEFRARVTKGYLVESRGIDAGRIKTIYGGRYKEIGGSATELWVAPEASTPPKPAGYENGAGEFKGKFAEYDTWDELFYEDGTGPPIGHVRLAGFADALKSQPETLAYIVSYNGEESATGAWRRVGIREVENLREYGVEADRVKLIFGGYRERAQMELWILPKDAPAPAEEVARERRPEEAVQIGRFDDYQLRYEDDERWVFKGFADVLKTDEHLRACIVIRPEMGGPEPQASDEGVDPDEPPDVNLTELVEKWKKDLLSEYGIGDERVVVMFGPAQDEYSSAELETWIVPPGAPLPDPFAAEEEGAGEEAEEPDETEAAAADETEPVKP